MNPTALSWCAVAALACSAHGALVNLSPGAGTGLVGTDSATDTELAGAVGGTVDELIPFQIFGEDAARGGAPLLYEGVLQNRIVVSEETGDYHFYYRIRDTNGSLNGIVASVVTTGFEGWETRVEYRTDGLGDQGPSRAERSIDGDLLLFLFGNPFFAPEESRSFFAATDAQAYTYATTTILLITGESVTLKTFAPEVPAPGALGVLAIGAAFTARRRR